MNKYIVLTLLVILLASGCKNNASETDNPVETTPTEILVQPITHDDFTAIKPKSWREAVLPQANLYKYFPPEVSSTDPHPENIMIVVSNTTESQTVKQIIDAVKESQKTNPDMRIIGEPKPANLGPLEGMAIKTERTFDEGKMESVQIFAKNDKKMYVMTYSCMVGNCKNYYVFEIMAKSIQPK